MLHVPEHHPGSRWMPEAPKRPADPRRHGPPVAYSLIAQVGPTHSRPTRQPVVHSGVVRFARALSRCAIGLWITRLARRAWDEPWQRHRDLRVDQGHPLGRERLKVESCCIFGGVGDLQDSWSVAIYQERLIAFAGD